MKETTLVILLLGLIYPASGQYNAQLIDTTKIWSTANTNTGGGQSVFSFFHKFSGDTIINNNSYVKIYKSSDEFMSEWELQGFAREIEGGIYLRNMANELGLAYDFNLEEGDSVFIGNPFAYYSYYAYVTDIDSVTLQPSGEKRKRLTLSCDVSPIPEYWIEGTGSNAGLLYSGCQMAQLTGSEVWALLCYFEGDQLIYKNLSFPVCFYPGVGFSENLQSKPLAEVYPNPVNGNSYIRYHGDEKGTIRAVIRNGLGVVVDEREFQLPGSLRIFSGDFSSGMYFYFLVKENERVACGKFIIQ
jgi:hypothetical protein